MENYPFKKILRLTRGLLISILAIVLAAETVRASSRGNPAYSALLTAQGITHKDGIFRLSGRAASTSAETAADKTKTTKTTKHYQISGYDMGGRETFIQFESSSRNGGGEQRADGDSVRVSFLITPEKVYDKTSSPATDWTERDLMAMLPKFISLGAMEQFFALELLNGNRLEMYKDYMSFGADETVAGADCISVQVDISRAQFADLTKELTKDIKTLLGPIAGNMTEAQLELTQTFAQRMLAAMDADIHFNILIDKTSGRIQHVGAEMDMANPYGDRTPGAVSRIQSESELTLYDFGKEVTRIQP